MDSYNLRNSGVKKVITEKKNKTKKKKKTFSFRSPLSLLLGFVSVFLIIRVSLRSFTDVVNDPFTDRIYDSDLELCQVSQEWNRFKPHSSFFSINPLFFVFSTVILSFPLIQEGQLSVSGERMCTILNRLED